LSSFNFGSYTDKVLGLSNEFFSTMYHKIFKQYWHNNRFTANMARNYVKTDWTKGQYEVYLPTAPHPTFNLNFMRVTIKVVLPGTRQQLHEDAETLHKSMICPAGNIDSELLVIVTPTQYHRGIIRGFRHAKKKGYLTAFVVTKIPEQAIKRTLCLLAEFYKKRIQGFLKSLRIEAPWKYDYKQFNSLYYSLIENFSYSIRLMLKNLSHTYEHFRSCIKAIYREFGLQNTVKQLIRPFKKRNLPERREIFKRLASKLQIQVMDGG
jgi:hypothetical protein